MKRIAYCMFVLICLFSLAACAANQVDYESNLYISSDRVREDIVNYLSEYKEQGIDLSIKAVKKTDGYLVNVGGTNIKIQMQDEEYPEMDLDNISEIDEKYRTIIDNARDRIVEYIISSKVLRDKEYLIQKITEVQVYATEDIGCGVYKNGNIYIDKELLETLPVKICEYTFVHEYIHALAAITNGGVENEAYAKNKFNEAMTDILASHILPNNSEEFLSAYEEYYYYILGYISCFHADAIDAYFYGYEKIWEITGKDNFDFFVECFARTPYDDEAAGFCLRYINSW